MQSRWDCPRRRDSSRATRLFVGHLVGTSPFGFTRPSVLLMPCESAILRSDAAANGDLTDEESKIARTIILQAAWNRQRGHHRRLPFAQLESRRRKGSSNPSR